MTDFGTQTELNASYNALILLPTGFTSCVPNEFRTVESEQHVDQWTNVSLHKGNSFGLEISTMLPLLFIKGMEFLLITNIIANIILEI